MKVVINSCFGGFGLSDEAWEKLKGLGIQKVDCLAEDKPKFRSLPEVVSVVEELGELANGKCAQLNVIEIPDDVEWHIEEYDGYESIHENHRSWGLD